jgi:hypothetical protein
VTPLDENPFFVLGVPCEASRIEIERESQKLLGMLELGFDAVKTYQTPVGPRIRTAEAVRAAVATLRDPYKRLVAEFWARHAPPARPAAPESDPETPPTRGIRRGLGWP